MEVIGSGGFQAKGLGKPKRRVGPGRDYPREAGIFTPGLAAPTPALTRSGGETNYPTSSGITLALERRQVYRALWQCQMPWANIDLTYPRLENESRSERGRISPSRPALP